ncbi:MAG: flavin-dependent dehydrogenase, partial [Myxococcota bacterium]
MGSVHYSVAILGGGPAGSICAALLRRGAPDQTILILEAERFPRHHVGEVSLPAWAPVLERAGILDALDQATAIKKAGVIFNWGPKDAPETWTADFREHHIGRPAVSSWHVDRATFDDQLLRHAAGLGATVLEEARVRTVTARPEGGFEIVWSTAEQEQRATADHVVDASGQARFLARHWSLGVQRHADMSNYAMYGYFTEDGIAQTDWPVAEDERWATIGTCDVGWVWHIPIRPGVVSVGVVTDRETMRSLGRDGRAEFYRQAIAGCPEIAPLLTDARWIGDTPDATEPESPPRVVSDWSYRVETLAGPGWFLAGDAAMFVDPILSSGMVLATRGASMAANALLTQWRHPQTDLELLRTSYQATYQDLAMAYHRMARVWYGRNLRAETWHWQARRERLRAGGLALYERDQDAFTALCLGAVADPLDAAVPEGSRDLRGTEFFSWLSARHLFQQDLSAHASWEEAPNADSARLATRRALMRQWQRLAHARVTPRGVTWQKGERYYTNLFRDEWS